jgi:hypothetical protein
VRPGPCGRAVWVALWTGTLYLGYIATNRWQLVPAQELPLTAIDRAIPFLPWTIVGYLALIGLIYLPVLIDDRALFRRCLVAMAVGQLLNELVFLGWPTIYPRPPLPDPERWGAGLYTALVAMDTPVNCFPSGHITSPAICCWALARHRPAWRWWIWGGFLLLAPSILSTKQHYLIDFFGGLGTAAIGIWASGRWWRGWQTGGGQTIDGSVALEDERSVAVTASGP